MKLEDVIRTITIIGKSQGVAEAAAKNRQLAGSINEVAQVSEKTSRSSLSVEQAMERQRRSLDVNYRATQIFNKGQRERDLGLAQGVIGLTEYNRLNALAKTRFDEMTGATDKSNNAFDRLANTLTRRFIFGAIIAQTRQLITYLIGLNSELAKTGDVASRTGIGGQAFQGIGTAAGYKGIGTGQFADDMLKFNTQVDRAKSGLGDLSALFRANGVSVRDTEDAFFKVADLVKNAASEAAKFSILQQAGLPATRDYVRLFEQGSAALREQANAAQKLSDDQLEQARKLEDRWNEMWTNFNRWGKAAILDTTSAMSAMGDAIVAFYLKANPALKNQIASMLPMGKQLSQIDADAYYKAVGIGGGQSPQGSKGGPTADSAKARELLAVEQQRLSLLGNLASVDEIIAAKNREILLSNTGITDEQRKQILARETILAQSSRLGNQLQFEREQLGRSPIEQQVASRLQGAGIDPASQQGQLYAGQIRLNEQLRIGKELATDFASGFARDMRNGVKASEALGNALGRLADRLMDMAINNLVSAAFSGGTAGGGGFLASLFSFIKHDGGVVGAGGPGRYIHPAYFDDAPRFAMGGMAGLGPDEVPIIAHKDEEIIRRDDPRHRYNGGDGGKGGDTFNYSPTFNDVTPDLLPKIEARLQMYGTRWKNEVFSEMKRRRNSDPSFYGS